MAAVVDTDKCTGCGDCVEDCPVEAITLSDEPKAVVDEEECTDCEVCVDTCPEGAISVPE